MQVSVQFFPLRDLRLRVTDEELSQLVEALSAKKRNAQHQALLFGLARSLQRSADEIARIEKTSYSVTTEAESAGEGEEA